MIKYKILSKEQLIISLDRLTRFKPTKDKYLRVFFDVILSCLQEPSYKKFDLEHLPVKQIKELAEEIINASINNYTKQDSDNNINILIKEYENSVFINDSDAQELLNNNINYKQAIKLIEDDSVVNLKWLKSLLSNNNLIEHREKYSLKYPIEKVILVEGLTEEILLPAFSKYLGYDFYKKGIQLIPAGGKNQVVKLYYRLSDELRIPIFLLLDNDAEENIKQIQPKLRKSDKIHLLNSGEFEDLLPKSLIIKAVNNDLSNFASISENDLDDKLPEAKNLENIFKEKGLHEFKKADFAKLVKNCISCDRDVSDEIKDIIEEITKF